MKNDHLKNHRFIFFSADAPSNNPGSDLADKFGQKEKEVIEAKRNLEQDPNQATTTPDDLIKEEDVQKAFDKTTQKIEDSIVDGPHKDGLNQKLTELVDKRKTELSQIALDQDLQLQDLHEQTVKDLEQFTEQPEVKEILDQLGPLFQNKDAVKEAINYETYKKNTEAWKQINDDLIKAVSSAPGFDINKLQKILNVSEDGKVGPNTMNAISALLGLGFTVEFGKETKKRNSDTPIDPGSPSGIGGDQLAQQSIDPALQQPQQPANGTNPAPDMSQIAANEEYIAKLREEALEYPVPDNQIFSDLSKEFADRLVKELVGEADPIKIMKAHENLLSRQLDVLTAAVGLKQVEDQFRAKDPSHAMDRAQAFRDVHGHEAKYSTVSGQSISQDSISMSASLDVLKQRSEEKKLEILGIRRDIYLSNFDPKYKEYFDESQNIIEDQANAQVDQDIKEKEGSEELKANITKLTKHINKELIGIEGNPDIASSFNKSDNLHSLLEGVRSGSPVSRSMLKIFGIDISGIDDNNELKEWLYNFIEEREKIAGGIMESLLNSHPVMAQYAQNARIGMSKQHSGGVLEYSQKLIQQIEGGMKEPGEYFMRKMHEDASRVLSDPYFLGLTSGPAYDFIKSLSPIQGNSEFANKINAKIRAMKENLKQLEDYKNGVESICKNIMEIEGANELVDAVKISVIILVSVAAVAVAGPLIAGVVAKVGLTGGAAAIATTSLSMGVSTVTGGAMTAAIEQDWRYMAPEVLAKQWALSMLTAGAARFAGGATGKLLGKGMDKVMKSSNAPVWLKDKLIKDAAIYARKLTNHSQTATGGFRAGVKQYMDEVGDEFFEEGMQKLGEAITPHDQLGGFAALLIASMGKSTKAEVGKQFLTDITNGTPIRFDYDERIAALEDLKLKGAPDEVLEQLKANGKVEFTWQGAKLEINIKGNYDTPDPRSSTELVQESEKAEMDVLGVEIELDILESELDKLVKSLSEKQKLRTDTEQSALKDIEAELEANGNESLKKIKEMEVLDKEIGELNKKIEELTGNKDSSLKKVEELKVKVAKLHELAQKAIETDLNEPIKNQDTQSDTEDVTPPLEDNNPTPEQQSKTREWLRKQISKIKDIEVKQNITKIIASLEVGAKLKKISSLWDSIKAKIPNPNLRAYISGKLEQAKAKRTEAKQRRLEAKEQKAAEKAAKQEKDANIEIEKNYLKKHKFEFGDIVQIDNADGTREAMIVHEVLKNGKIILESQTFDGTRGELKTVNQSDVIKATPEGPLKRMADSKELLEKYYKNNKQFDLTSDVISDTNFSIQRTITIDGVKFHLGQIMENTRQRKQVVMLVDTGDGKLLPRILYKSDSGGCWRGTRGYNVAESLYDKGIFKENYATETKVDQRISDYLDMAESKKAITNVGKTDHLNDLFKMTDSKVQEVQTYESEIRLAQENILTQFNEYGYQPGEIIATNTSDYLISLDGKFPDGFIPDFSKPPIEQKIRKHSLFGDTTVMSYKSKLNGRDVVWDMAIDKDNRVWIEGISLHPSKVSTYGTTQDLLSIGVLGYKPAEYNKQSSGLNKNERIPITFEYENGYSSSGYHDITPVIDNLLPIRKFREARSIYRNEYPSQLIVNRVTP